MTRNLLRFAHRRLTREVRRVRKAWDPGERFQRDFGDGWIPIVERVHRAVPKASSNFVLIGAVSLNGALALGLDAPGRMRGGHVEGADLVRMIVDDAQARASFTCEVCGRRGQLHRAGGRLRVLCEWDRRVAAWQVPRPGRLDV